MSRSMQAVSIFSLFFSVDTAWDTPHEFHDELLPTCLRTNEQLMKLLFTALVTAASDLRSGQDRRLLTPQTLMLQHFSFLGSGE